jgi:hypothetical protein
MILVDAGFLYALLDKDDAWHVRASAASEAIKEKWITTWPVLTEAVHLISRWMGVDQEAPIDANSLFLRDGTRSRSRQCPWTVAAASTHAKGERIQSGSIPSPVAYSISGMARIVIFIGFPRCLALACLPISVVSVPIFEQLMSNCLWTTRFCMLKW